MVEQIHILLSDSLKIVLSLYLHRLRLHPAAVFPVGAFGRYLTDIDFRIKVCGKGIAVITSVAVQDIDIVNLIKFMLQRIG